MLKEALCPVKMASSMLKCCGVKSASKCSEGCLDVCCDQPPLRMGVEEGRVRDLSVVERGTMLGSWLVRGGEDKLLGCGGGCTSDKDSGKMDGRPVCKPLRGNCIAGIIGLTMAVVLGGSWSLDF